MVPIQGPLQGTIFDYYGLGEDATKPQKVTIAGVQFGTGDQDFDPKNLTSSIPIPSGLKIYGYGFSSSKGRGASGLSLQERSDRETFSLLRGTRMAEDLERGTEGREGVRSGKKPEFGRSLAPLLPSQLQDRDTIRMSIFMTTDARQALERPK